MYKLYVCKHMYYVRVHMICNMYVWENCVPVCIVASMYCVTYMCCVLTCTCMCEYICLAFMCMCVGAVYAHVCVCTMFQVRVMSKASMQNKTLPVI